MHCTVIKNNEGHPIGMICRGSRTPRRLCKFCQVEFARKLCDFDTGRGKTCDAPMCDKCATEVGTDRDYCPDHKHEKGEPAQAALSFG